MYACMHRSYLMHEQQIAAISTQSQYLVVIVCSPAMAERTRKDDASVSAVFTVFGSSACLRER